MQGNRMLMVGRGEDSEEIGLFERGAEALGGDAASCGPLLTEGVEGAMAQDRQILSPLADADPALVLAKGDIEDPVDAILNGLIANDKICVVRTARLLRDRGRSSPSRGHRCPPGPVYPSAETDRRGGGAETAVAHATGTAGDTGRTATLGSRLSGAPAVDAPRRRDPGGDGGRAGEKGAG